jgi:hypothetical protein
VYLASCVQPCASYDPANLKRWAQECGDCVPTEQTENPAPAVEAAVPEEISA